MAVRTAYDLVWMAADRTPEGLALVDDRSDRALTYRQLIDEVDVVAAGFQARGIGPGSRVLTALPNLFEHCLALLALQRLAAVPALLNFRLGVEEIGKLASRAEVAAAFVLPSPELLRGLRELLGDEAVLLVAGEADGAEPFAECRGNPAELTQPIPDPEDESFLFYTSGTTGLPKAVVLAHRTDEPRVVWLSTMMGLRSHSSIRALGVSPLSHAIGFCVFLSTLAFGGTFYTLSEFVPDRALDLIENRSINNIFSLPTIYAAMVAAPSYQPQRMQSLETVYWGGAAIDPELLERLMREWPATFGHIYGATEVMCALCNAEPAGSHDVLYPAYSARIRVVHTDGGANDGMETEVGEQGELLIDATGDAIFSGYLGEPEETAAKMRDGWYYSGDAAVRGEDGSVRLVGRADDMIRSGGEYIQPEEVETCLLEHPHVAAGAVVGIPDPKWGQLAIAVIVPSAETGQATDWADLDRHCRQSPMANFKRPRAYLIVEALPMSAGGKLHRKRLREMAEAAQRGDSHSTLYTV
jgi:2-furoate---CoA ligase